MTMSPSPFFHPSSGWVGDVIPFAREDEFSLFYLHDERSEPKPGTSWNLVTTSDGVHFIDRGVALAHGSDDVGDFNAYTGSIVVDATGVYHLFYTGQNPRVVGDDGAPLQLVMHATSSGDMASWRKLPEHSFGATAGYETSDWRDPFVFLDERSGTWRMLLAARHRDGADRRRGVIAEMVSSDLATWEPAAPFWNPRRYITMECPEVFQWGGWWYLVYSEFSESFSTRYRMAKSPDGPWAVPERDSVDGRAFYASKTAERDGRRFFFGWIATKEGSTDDGRWQWAGSLSALEARQSPDGTLRFGFSDELVASFTEKLPLAFEAERPAHLASVDGYAAAVTSDDAPERFYLTATFDIAAGTTECGVLLRSSSDGDASYIVRLEPKRGRMVFDRWPREVHGTGQWEVSGDVPFEIELERPCDLDPGVHTIEIIVDGDICVAVLDRCVALSTRIYDRPTGRIGVFVGEGAARVTDLRLLTRADN